MPDSHRTTYADIVGMVAPGSELHEGLENILRAKTGALILVSDSEEVIGLMEGGFTSTLRLHQLLYTSWQKWMEPLFSALMASEFSMRTPNSIRIRRFHRAKPEPGTERQRVAKQTGALVISISQRRNLITLYKDDWKYVIKDVSVTLAKANQALQTLEKYRTVLLEALADLTAMEFEDTVTLYDICVVIQKDQLLNKIADEIENYITELGTEGRLVEMQLVELMADVQDQGLLVIEDYLDDNTKTSKDVFEELRKLTSEEIVELTSIAKILGYSGSMNALEQTVPSRGIRLLSKIPRLPKNVINNIVDAFGGLNQLLDATIDDLDDIEGIGEVRARAIQEGLRRLKSHAVLEKQKAP